MFRLFTFDFSRPCAEPDEVPTNLYTFLIQENIGDSGVRHLEQIIDANAELLDESKALDIFRRAMPGEVNFFRSACGQSPWNTSG